MTITQRLHSKVRKLAGGGKNIAAEVEIIGKKGQYANPKAIQSSGLNIPMAKRIIERVNESRWPQGGNMLTANFDETDIGVPPRIEAKPFDVQTRNSLIENTNQPQQYQRGVMTPNYDETDIGVPARREAKPFPVMGTDHSYMDRNGRMVEYSRDDSDTPFQKIRNEADPSIDRLSPIQAILPVVADEQRSPTGLIDRINPLKAKMFPVVPTDHSYMDKKGRLFQFSRDDSDSPFQRIKNRFNSEIAPIRSVQTAPTTRPETPTQTIARPVVPVKQASVSPAIRPVPVQKPDDFALRQKVALEKAKVLIGNRDSVKTPVRKDQTTGLSNTETENKPGTPVVPNTSYKLPNDVIRTRDLKMRDPKWKTFKGKYYVMSKEDSQLYAFDHNHKLIDSTVAIRGASPGDGPNKSNTASEEPGNRATTPAGSYVITAAEKEGLADYATPFYRIAKDDKDFYKRLWENNGLGLHGIYKDELEFRTSVMKNPKIMDKLVSWGCINVDEKWLNKPNTKPVPKDSLFITPTYSMAREEQSRRLINNLKKSL